MRIFRMNQLERENEIFQHLPQQEAFYRELARVTSFAQDIFEGLFENFPWVSLDFEKDGVTQHEHEH